MITNFDFQPDLPLDVVYTRTLLTGEIMREQITVKAREWRMADDGIRYLAASRTLVLIPWSRVERVEQYRSKT